MRRIKKGQEPPCLEELRQTPGADWSSVTGKDKQEMREHAWVEQHGLCAYCMSWLQKTDDASMKIEHYETRAGAKEKQFYWNNLLGVCKGDIGVEEGEKGGDHRFHCDTYRGNLITAHQTLYVHPAQFPPDAGVLFSYTLEGEIRPAQGLSPDAQNEVRKTIERLNLNIARLKRNRKAVIAAARKELEKKATRKHVEQLLEIANKPNSKNRLNPYAQIAVVYFTKKLRQLQ